MKVNTLFANCVGYCCSARVAGPFATEPVVVKREPWHGQTNWLLANPVTEHPSWVQTAVSAENVSCAVRARRNVPRPVWTVAAELTAASGDPLSTVTDMVRPLTVPFTVLSVGAFEEGEVLLPPQAANVPAASNAAV